MKFTIKAISLSLLLIGLQANAMMQSLAMPSIVTNLSTRTKIGVAVTAVSALAAAGAYQYIQVQKAKELQNLNDRFNALLVASQQRNRLAMQASLKGRVIVVDDQRITEQLEEDPSVINARNYNMDVTRRSIKNQISKMNRNQASFFNEKLKEVSGKQNYLLTDKIFIDELWNLSTEVTGFGR